MSGYFDVTQPTAPMPGMNPAGAQAAIAGAGQQAAPSLLSDQSQGLINNNINPMTGAPMKPGFFGQGGAAQIGLGAISTLGSLWNSFQQSKIANKSLKLQERAFETNLSNQTQTYNTELEDRIRTRYAAEGRSDQADAYVERNKL